MNTPLGITGLGTLSALGPDLPAHREALAAGREALRPLGEMEGAPEGFDELRAGWIEPRELLCDRKWSPSSMAAIHVARQALESADWSDEERREAVVFFGTSRGPLAGWTDPWPGRREFDLLAATNSLPAEPAAAVSATFGIGGPWQVSSTGCCAGLDALADAEMWIRSGRITRALVVAVDLPLVHPVLDAYERTGLFGKGHTNGMRPAEAAAALCLEATEADHPRLLGCHAASDASALLGNGRDSECLATLLKDAVHSHGTPDLIIPHASGTPQNRQSEEAALASIGTCPVTRYKPHTGHGVGASGLLELVLACGGCFPEAIDNGTSLIFKLASALGGRHSLCCLSR